LLLHPIGGRTTILGKVFRAVKSPECTCEKPLPRLERDRKLGLRQLRLHRTSGSAPRNNGRTVPPISDAMKVSTFTVIVAAVVLMAYLQRPAPQLQLALVDRAGNRQDLGSVPIATFAPRISPSGKQVAFDTNDG